MQRLRDVHEQVLQIYALEVNRSAKFWDPYLKVEKDVLSEMIAAGAAESDVSRQVGRVRSIYRRRVIFPTSDMLVTWNEYKDWESDPAEIARLQDRHDQAVAKIDQMVTFEEQFQ